jgi:hypothetical protein
VSQLFHSRHSKIDLHNPNMRVSKKNDPTWIQP